MSGPVDQAREAGYSDEEIQAHLAPKIAEAQAAGYSPDEINAHLGIRPVNVAAANQSLAKSVGAHLMDAVKAVGETTAKVMFPVGQLEAALNLTSGVVGGGLAYMAGGVKQLAARALGTDDTDPQEVGKRWANAVTYEPRTASGQRMSSIANTPLEKLSDWSVQGGHWVTDKTGSAVAGALTEATIQTLPAALLGALGRGLAGKTPAPGDFRAAADNLSRGADGVPKADPAAVTNLGAKVQDVYEKTGIDPQTLHDHAAQDVTVLQDLASSNKTPFEGPPEPPKAPPAAPEPPPTPELGTPEAAQAAVLDRVSVGEQSAKTGTTLDSLYTAAKDDLYPIAKVEKALSGGADLPTAESPYTLARLTRGAAGKAAQFLDHGTFDFNTYENTGPGLKEILDPVKDDLDGMRAYAVAKRSVELAGRGIETGVPLEDAQAVVKNGGKYADTFKKLQTYQDSLVDYLRDSGVLKPDAVDAMREANKDFVPFFRVMGGEPGGMGAGFGVRNPIKSIKGSERIIVDPLESIIKNTYVYTALAERNAVGKAFGDLVGKNPDAAADLGIAAVPTKMKPIEVTTDELAAHGADAEAFTIFRPNAMNPAPNQIRYFEDGKPITMEVPPDVAEAFNATDRQSAGLLMKVLAVPAKTLRAGSVLTPDFMLRNVIRDQLTAFTFSKNGYIPVWDMMSGAFSLAAKDGAFQDWLKSGGANATMISMDRQYLQQHLFELDKETGLGSRAWNVAKSPLEVLRIGSELMENATRLGEFKRAMVGESGKSAIQDAGFESREVTLDFQRIGAQTRGLNMIAAFMNASIEGMDRTVRAFKDQPMGTTAKVAAGITVPSILLWAANHNDPRWKEIPDWERDLFWIVMTNDHVYRVPKPFELGVIFGSVPERMLDKFADEKPDVMKNFLGTLGQAFGVNVMPTAAVPLLEQATNHSFFTGNPLIPSRLEGILPEYQYHEYTSELTKEVGRIVGAFPGLHDQSIASPIVIDNYVRGWTGSMGAYVTQALDAGLRKAGVLPDPPTPIATLADIPVVKAFMVRYPSGTAQSIQDFYDDYGKRKTVYTTFQYLVKNGDPDAAMKEANLDPGAFARLDGVHSSIGQSNADIRMVYKNPDIKPDEKRQLIDSMYGQMTEMARAGNEAMAAVDKVLGK